MTIREIDTTPYGWTLPRMPFWHERIPYQIRLIVLFDSVCILCGRYLMHRTIIKQKEHTHTILLTKNSYDYLFADSNKTKTDCGIPIRVKVQRRDFPQRLRWSSSWGTDDDRRSIQDFIFSDGYACMYMHTYAYIYESWNGNPCLWGVVVKPVRPINALTEPNLRS